MLLVLIQLFIDITLITCCYMYISNQKCFTLYVNGSGLKASHYSIFYVHVLPILIITTSKLYFYM